ncbi:hypothetical protein NHF46_14285 [Arthrobacter alpinus]|nr:hypothetical protein [Arthrobacter alpinus]
MDIGGHRTKVARLDTPEQVTLPITLGIGSATTKIGFSTNASTTALLAAKTLGFFRWGRGERWTACGVRFSIPPDRVGAPSSALTRKVPEEPARSSSRTPPARPI